MSARIECAVRSLRATGRDGRAFELPYQDIRLELGGASGRMVFCRNRERTLTFFTEEKGFLHALREASRSVLEDEIYRLLEERRGRRRRMLVVLGILIAIVIGTFYAARPIIRSAVATLLPFSVDEAIGRTAHASMEKGGPVVSNERVDEALDAMIGRLQPHAALPEAEFQVEVVRSDIVNAYALPGGYLVVFTGLLEKAERPEEVAGVLAHEMAHVTLRHGLQRVVQSAGVVLVVTALFGDATGVVALAVELFTWQSINSYSRGSEEEADAEGVRMLHEAGIDPAGLMEFFGRLSEEAEDTPDVLSWVGSHPSHQSRMESIRSRLRELEDKDYEPVDIDWEAVKASLD
jgi:predicted Zn-dependent protease